RVSAARTKTEGRRNAAVADRSTAAPPADRPDRQHAPRGILDRQAIFARQSDRTSRSARISRVRDAAARADERRADAALARIGGAILARAVSRIAGPVGYRAARPLAAAALRRGRPARRRRRSCAAWLPIL